MYKYVVIEWGRGLLLRTLTTFFLSMTVSEGVNIETTSEIIFLNT